MFARHSQLDFILLGNICSDYLEGRFGWYRQLCGANYYNSVTQFLQAEKTIRLKSLVNMGFDMTQIKVMFETTEINHSLEQVEEIKVFTSDLESFKFHNTTTTLLDSEQAIIYYIAGYIAKSLTKAKCIACRTLVCPGKVDMPLIIEELPDIDDTDDSIREAGEVYQSLLIIFISHLCMHHLCIVLFLIMKTCEIPYLVHKIQEKPL